MYMLIWRRQVQNGHGGLADELLRLIVTPDAGEDDPIRAGAVVQRKLQQLVALFHRLAVLDLHRPQIGLAEGVEVHLLLRVGLHLQRRQRRLALLSLQLLQLCQRLFGVDTGEQSLALMDRGVGAQGAPYVGLLPGAAALTGADLVEDFLGALRHKGHQQRSADADGLQQMIHHRSQPHPVGGILGQRPRGVLVDILVGPLDGLEHLLQRILELEALHLRLIAIPEGGGHGPQLRIRLALLPLRGQGAAEVLLHHGGGAAHQIAQIVSQIDVDGLDQQLIGEIAVAAEGEGPQQEEPQGIHAELLRQQIGIHHIPLGLGHLAAVQQQPAVAVDLLGQGHLHAHEHGRPDDGVEAHDLLAHEVDIGGPVLLIVVILVIQEAQRRGVVEQGVHPHIDHVAGIEVHRDLLFLQQQSVEKKPNEQDVAAYIP